MLGKALRTVEYMAGFDKAYLSEVSFGTSTDSYDAEGNVVENVDPSLVTYERLDNALRSFIGTVMQTPPMFSALKRDGQKLYDLARKGQIINIEPRQVTIHSIYLSRYEHNKAILQVNCSKGTYIRSLAHDLGQVLGCPSHLSALKRTSCGPFRLEDAYTLDVLDQAATENCLERFVLPVDSGITYMPSVVLSNDDIIDIKFGRAVEHHNFLLRDGDKVRVYDEDKIFVSVCNFCQNALRPVKVFL